MTAYANGCYSTDSTDRRVKSETMLMQNGWRVMQRGEIITREPVMIEVTTDWVNKECMRLQQTGFRDENCAGCAHDTESS